MRNRIAIALVLIAGGLPTYALPCAGEDIPLPPGLAGYQLADCNDVKWYRVTIPWAGRLSWIVSPGLVWGSGPDVQFTVYKDPATCTGANVATTCARADDVQTRLDVDVLAPGTYYAVATCCPSGHLGDGHFVLQVIFDCDRPDPPTGVTATKGSYPDKVVVTWNAVARADAYQVSRDGGTFISAWQAALSYTDTNVWNCEIHSYQVRAKQSVCGAGGEGISWSDADTGYITPPNPVFAPTGVTASANPVCAGSTVTLTAQGGSGGTYTWYYGNCCGDPICRLGQGNPLQIAAWVTNTYAVRIESVACGNSDCASITMQVSREPVAPMSAQASSNPACPGSQVTLTAAGGSGTYEWYANHCGTENGQHAHWHLSTLVSIGHRSRLL